MPRATSALATVLLAGAAAAAVRQAQAHPDEALATSWLPAVAVVAASVAGLRAGRWLAAAAVAVVARTLPLPEAGGALAFAAALVLGPAVPALAGAAALRGVAGRRRGDAALAGGLVAAVVVVLGIVPAATFDPHATGCFACPRNLLLVTGDEGVRDAAVTAGQWLAAAGCAAVAALALWRWLRGPALARLPTAPLAVGGALVAGLGAAGFAHAAPGGTPVLDATAEALWRWQCVALVATAGGVGALAVRDRLLSGRMAAVVVDTIPSPERLQAALAGALGDPSLRLAFPGDGGGGPGVTAVTRGAEVIAELHHDPALGPRVAAAARGAGLALEHASLRVRLEREIEELRASRTRVVEVGDAERRRLERDLHDGAQQRLIALTVALEPGRARDEVRTALAELRELARGIHPVALTDAGLAAALPVLAEVARVPVRIEAVPEERLPADVEAAVHRLVLDALRCAERHGDRRTVTVTITAGLAARLTLPGVTAADAEQDLAHARDRIVALDGELAVTAGACEARIPCAS